MTSLFKKKRIQKLAQGAEELVTKLYREKTPSNVHYSLKDSYDSDSVSVMMTDYSKYNDTEYLLKRLDRGRNRTFTECVIEKISQKQLKDSAVYKAAQIDRRLFSKMMSDKDYKPAKDTALAIIFALQLPLSDAQDMLSRAGYTLSHSSKRDIIIEYFFKEKHFNLDDVNAVLDQLGQKVIGR